ncbi:TIGR02444 family protein [Oricola indica]|uniref:TIGR02444 family protein n=1 Tax=Oricola indica TaxID=2872591 RepID=UPI003CCC037A
MIIVKLNETAISFAFWEFSIQRYSRVGVAPICLTLQDEVGLDVNIVLFLLWVGHQGRKISGDTAIEKIHSAVGRWHREHVVPLRTVRHAMKGCSHPDPQQVEAVRQKLKSVEIEVERLEQAILSNLFSCGFEKFLLPEAFDARSAMTHNVSIYLGATEEQRRAEIEKLVDLCH